MIREFFLTLVQSAALQLASFLEPVTT